MPTSSFWITLGSIVALLNFSVICYAAIITLKQLKEATRFRHLQAMLQVYEQIGSNDARASRRYIYTELTSPPGDETSVDRFHIETVSVALDRIGVLVKSKLVPETELFSGHWEMIVRCWRQLKPHIEHHRATLQSSSHVIHFEQLALSAEAYGQRNHPNAQLLIAT